MKSYLCIVLGSAIILFLLFVGNSPSDHDTRAFFDKFQDILWFIVAKGHDPMPLRLLLLDEGPVGMEELLVVVCG